MLLLTARTSSRAHPRTYGENADFTMSILVAVGSSPRIRGKLLPHPGRHDRRGLTPAHTGKTSRLQHTLNIHRAHPRTYGENRMMSFATGRIAGSSPHIRGKLRLVAFVISFGGLIPAHTGKTQSVLAGMRLSGAHPRAYGENSRLSSRRVHLLGSSPRIRGKLLASSAGLGAVGLIPAHTGKTE